MLTIVTALLCEARPLISDFNLKKVPESHPYPIYRNDELNLVISGIGKIASASATAYVHALNGSCNHSAWLNIGLAGHSDYELETGFLAIKIIDQSCHQSWYPSIIFEPSCQTGMLITVDQVGKKYHPNYGVDMEASGFYATACRFTTSELVQCFKVVSDNPQTPVRKIAANEASKLISDQMEHISSIIDALGQLQTEIDTPNQTPPFFNEIMALCKMTHSEQLLLREKLKRLFLLNPNHEMDFSLFVKPHQSKNILFVLEKLISEQKVLFQ